MESMQESTKGLDTSTQDKEVSRWEKIKNGLKQGEVKWAIGSGVCFLFLRILLAGLSKTQNIDFAYYLIVLSMYGIYFYIFLACFIPITMKIASLLICFSLIALVFFFFNIHVVCAVILALTTALIMLLLYEMLTKKDFGKKVLGNFFILGSIVFVLWQVFMSCPDSNENALNINCSVDIFEGGETPNKAIDSSTPFVLENRAVLIVSLGVFIYTAFLCTAIRSRLRWVLYCAAGSLVFFTGASYYQDSAPVIQISVFLLFLVIFCSILPFIADDIEKEYPEVSERLGRTRAYNRLHAWIRRSLKKEEGKAVLLWGKWGTGKTHCIQYLAHRLSMEQPETDQQCEKEPTKYDKKQYDEKLNGDNAFMGKVKICKINLWEFESREDAWNEIVQTLGETILGRDSFLISPRLNKYLSGIIRCFSTGNIISNLYELVFLSDSTKNELLCQNLSDAIDSKKRIVLIFDDVERANYSIIKSLPSLIDRLHNIKKLMILFAISKDELALLHKKELSQENSEDVALEVLSGYLTKIFDYSFSIPELSRHKERTFIDEVLKKYSDCHLTDYYMKNCGLRFTTPRQIERTIELLGEIERQFFYDTDIEKIPYYKLIIQNSLQYNRLYSFYVYTVFLVEIIRNFYPQVLHAAQISMGGTVAFAQEVTSFVEMLKKGGAGATNSDKRKLKKFKKYFNYIYILTRTDHFAVDLVKGLGECDQEKVQKAVAGTYKRRINLSERECRELYMKNKDKEPFDFEEALSSLFKGKEAIPEDIDSSKMEFFEYIFDRVTDESDEDDVNVKEEYVKFFLKLIHQGGFEDDEENSESEIFKWSIEHFLHLLHVHTRYASDTQFVKRAALEMFSRASVSEKAFVLKEFYKGDDKKEPKKEVEYQLHDRLYTLLLEEIKDVIMKLHLEYVKHIISNLLDCKIQAEKIVGKLYLGYHFYDLVKNEFAIEVPHISIPEGTRDEGLINLIDFVTLQSGFEGGYDGEQMATSEFKATLFLPTLRVWFDSHSVSSVLSAQIDRWIEKCEASIEYWSKDQTKLNKRRNYTVGAEKVKKFLEDLKAKKESHVENKAGKTSE